MFFWWVLGASCGELVANMVPTWVSRWSPNRWEMESKINRIFIAFWNQFLIRFCLDFWWKNRGKLSPRSIQNRCALRKAMFWKNIVFLKEKPYFWRCWRSRLGLKIDQKYIKNWTQHRKVFWHRFLIEFCRFLHSTWETKSAKTRCQKAFKK